MGQKQTTFDGRPIGAFVDYLTMTTAVDHLGVSWYEVFVTHVRNNGNQDNVPMFGLVKNVKRYGFDCQIFEGMTWGYSEQHKRYYFQLTGTVAHEHWRHIVVPPMIRCTRIDLAVTCELQSPKNLALDAWEKIQKTGPPGKTKTYRLIRGLNGGDTIYVGSRQSVEMGRLYDKGVESGSAGKNLRWRYELEAHNPRANSILTQMYNKLVEGEKVATVLNHAAANVGAWFGVRGVNPVFATGEAMVIEDQEMRLATPQRKLAWLRSQVAPTIEELIQLGLGPQVAQALGLGMEQMRLMGFDAGD